MSGEDVKMILGEIASLKALVIERTGGKPLAPNGDLTVDQFAAAIGRKPLYVYRRIGSRQIAVRAGGRPYRIPADQVTKFQKVRATV